LPARAGSRKDAAHANFGPLCRSSGSSGPAQTAGPHSGCFALPSRTAPDYEKTAKLQEAAPAPDPDRFPPGAAPILSLCGPRAATLGPVGRQRERLRQAPTRGSVGALPYRIDPVRQPVASKLLSLAVVVPAGSPELVRTGAHGIAGRGRIPYPHSSCPAAEDAATHCPNLRAIRPASMYGGATTTQGLWSASVMPASSSEGRASFSRPGRLPKLLSASTATDPFRARSGWRHGDEREARDESGYVAYRENARNGYGCPPRHPAPPPIRLSRARLRTRHRRLCGSHGAKRVRHSSSSQ